MSSEVAIRAQALSKVYRIYGRPEDRLIQMATLGRRRPFTEFPALSDVSLEIRRGETVGIIGRNGSGKSTLLQMICGTLQPSAGQLEVNGRIAALLELGAGFNGEFTGRENVYMNGAILGFSREEMDARFGQIVDFAAIGPFIERPVKTYSSGMFVRLAFAVATAVEPDILVVDEALAVGDEAFQRKCFARIEGIKDRGGTILFVSHGAQTIVQLCDRAILLDGGEKLLEGFPKRVVSHYQRLINLSGDAVAQARDEIRRIDGYAPDTPPFEPERPVAEAVDATDFPPNEVVTQESADTDESFFDPGLISDSFVDYGQHGACISDVRFETADGRRVNVLMGRRRYVYRYTVEFSENLKNIGFGMMIKTTSGLDIAGAATDFEKTLALKEISSGDVFDVSFEIEINLNEGAYFLNAGVTTAGDDKSGYAHRLLDVMAIRVMPPTQRVATGIANLDPKPIFSLREVSIVDDPTLHG